MAARWLLTASVTSVAAVIAVNALHGFSFIVFNYCLAVYINEHVPDELKASGQTLNALICIGLGRLSGSVLGGLLSDRIGLADTFLVNGLLGFGTAAIFGLIFWLRRERRPVRPASE
jgi:PPP family 3-phenylpropionic acid transporter